MYGILRLLVDPHELDTVLLSPVKKGPDLVRLFVKGIESGDQFMWWAHEKSKIVNGGKIKGLTIVTGFTNSEKLTWMNNLIFALEVDGSTLSNEFKAVAYEWK